MYRKAEDDDNENEDEENEDDDNDNDVFSWVLNVYVSIWRSVHFFFLKNFKRKEQSVTFR
jgi:hypothetical protein